ncbi:MAG: spondin domain-containing protein [Acidobacteria bacterium]|nr:spondin domain-containing protein [Acidobacteriota bacterium]
MTLKSKSISIPATLFALAIVGLSTFTLNPTSARSTTVGQDSAASTAAASRGGARFEVEVTNLTRGQQFTPILVASHREGVKLFTLGNPASSQLATLAEEGNTAPLGALLSGTPAVRDVASGSGLTDPGKSVILTVDAPGSFDHVSVAAMLIPTNDGFFAINGVEGPRGNKDLTLFSPAYDAGSERNDELCASIPGPFFMECGGPGGGGMPAGDEEGFVHIHAGIHGIGNLMPARRDWRNPVAKIIIRRIR